ncbi:MAG: hypothetical protein KJP08_09530 [Gammaproteobacteria bacterium]|nr:hypothetical protein [Gammaproteobacteria bacterium]NNF50285.1 hypothetical protein [Woeseiaceae bacterium]MBT8095039.1 hypothetical protein [Gammaproteobacteria bacterium]MBT8105592.1 hypothetical protein [Gammaproteobacteria bacterium]NNK25606.1 hypothetical protein [Woeseiaceae bacterium]
MIETGPLQPVEFAKVANEEGRYAMSSSGHAQSRRTFVTAAVSVSVAGLISSGHHVYGALAYETPWRLAVSLWIPAFVLFVLSMLFLLWKYANRPVANIAAWFVLFSGVVFQAGFTLFECVYSHVLKNILFFGGVSQEVLLRLFPAPTYHLPDNMLFELTGVAQLAGFWAAWCAWRVFQKHLIRK